MAKKQVASVDDKWLEADKQAQGQFITLKEDGETASFLILGPPEVEDAGGRFKGTKRYVLPAWQNGPKVVTVNAGTFKLISAVRSKLDTHTVTLTRHGEPEDQKTYYEVTLAKDVGSWKKQRQEAKELAKALGDVPF